MTRDIRFDKLFREGDVSKESSHHLKWKEGYDIIKQIKEAKSNEIFVLNNVSITHFGWALWEWLNLTWSFTLIQIRDQEKTINIWIDLWMVQWVPNAKEINKQWEFDPLELDYLIVTHAHADHSFRVPWVIRKAKNEQKEIKTRMLVTKETKLILPFMWYDCANILSKEVWSDWLEIQKQVLETDLAVMKNLLMNSWLIKWEYPFLEWMSLDDMDKVIERIENKIANMVKKKDSVLLGDYLRNRQLHVWDDLMSLRKNKWNEDKKFWVRVDSESSKVNLWQYADLERIWSELFSIIKLRVRKKLESMVAMNSNDAIYLLLFERICEKQSDIFEGWIVSILRSKESHVFDGRWNVDLTNWMLVNELIAKLKSWLWKIDKDLAIKYNLKKLYNIDSEEWQRKILEQLLRSNPNVILDKQWTASVMIWMIEELVWLNINDLDDIKSMQLNINKKHESLRRLLEFFEKIFWIESPKNLRMNWDFDRIMQDKLINLWINFNWLEEVDELDAMIIVAHQLWIEKQSQIYKTILEPDIKKYLEKCFKLLNKYLPKYNIRQLISMQPDERKELIYSALIQNSWSFIDLFNWFETIKNLLEDCVETWIYSESQYQYKKEIYSRSIEIVNDIKSKFWWDLPDNLKKYVSVVQLEGIANDLVQIDRDWLKRLLQNESDMIFDVNKYVMWINSVISNLMESNIRNLDDIDRMMNNIHNEQVAMLTDLKMFRYLFWMARVTPKQMLELKLSDDELLKLWLNKLDKFDLDCVLEYILKYRSWYIFDIKQKIDDVVAKKNMLKKYWLPMAQLEELILVNKGDLKKLGIYIRDVTKLIWLDINYDMAGILGDENRLFEFFISKQWNKLYFDLERFEIIWLIDGLKSRWFTSKSDIVEFGEKIKRVKNLTNHLKEICWLDILLPFEDLKDKSKLIAYLQTIIQKIDNSNKSRQKNTRNRIVFVLSNIDTIFPQICSNIDELLWLWFSNYDDIKKAKWLYSKMKMFYKKLEKLWILSHINFSDTSHELSNKIDMFLSTEFGFKDNLEADVQRISWFLQDLTSWKTLSKQIQIELKLLFGCTDLRSLKAFSWQTETIRNRLKSRALWLWEVINRRLKIRWLLKNRQELIRLWFGNIIDMLWKTDLLLLFSNLNNIFTTISQLKFYFKWYTLEQILDITPRKFRNLVWNILTDSWLVKDLEEERNNLKLLIQRLVNTNKWNEIVYNKDIESYIWNRLFKMKKLQTGAIELMRIFDWKDLSEIIWLYGQDNEMSLFVRNVFTIYDIEEQTNVLCEQLSNLHLNWVYTNSDLKNLKSVLWNIETKFNALRNLFWWDLPSSGFDNLINDDVLLAKTVQKSWFLVYDFYDSLWLLVSLIDNLVKNDVWSVYDIEQIAKQDEQILQWLKKRLMVIKKLFPNNGLTILSKQWWLYKKVLKALDGWWNKSQLVSQINDCSWMYWATQIIDNMQNRLKRLWKNGIVDKSQIDDIWKYEIASKVLFNENDVADALAICEWVDYWKEVDLMNWLKLKFVNAWHSYWSAQILIQVRKSSWEYVSLWFSWDLWRKTHPWNVWVPEPFWVKLDYYQKETTYWWEFHPNIFAEEQRFIDAINKSISKWSKKILVPVFMYQRAQDILLMLIKKQKMWLIPKKLKVYLHWSNALNMIPIYITGDWQWGYRDTVSKNYQLLKDNVRVISWKQDMDQILKNDTLVLILATWWMSQIWSTVWKYILWWFLENPRHAFFTTWYQSEWTPWAQILEANKNWLKKIFLKWVGDININAKVESFKFSWHIDQHDSWQLLLDTEFNEWAILCLNHWDWERVVKAWEYIRENWCVPDYVKIVEAVVWQTIQVFSQNEHNLNKIFGLEDLT